MEATDAKPEQTPEKAAEKPAALPPEKVAPPPANNADALAAISRRVSAIETARAEQGASVKSFGYAVAVAAGVTVLFVGFIAHRLWVWLKARKSTNGAVAAQKG
ncbi:MAG: hypothetical protein JST92_27635 [Deltaproteobacteria bacterium]|nr:hypothetical protein [Deltaproteobacteria bacterium]